MEMRQGRGNGATPRMRATPRRRALAAALLGCLLAGSAATAWAASPPSRRSRAFDGQPAAYAGRGILDPARAPGSPLPWPTVGSWLIKPLRAAPELDPLMSEEPAPPPARSESPVLAPPSPVVDIPLPPKRPPSLGGMAPLATDSRDFAAGGDCFSRLRAAGTTFAPAGQQGGSSACAIESPVQISAVAERGTPGGSIILPDKPIISCRMALRFGDWLRSVAPALAASRNSAIVSITTGPGWECRTRNRQPGGKLSPRATGEAPDITTTYSPTRGRLPVQGHGRDPAFQTIRLAACNYFTTVLGPGSAFHDSHLHLDIMRHSHSFRLCR